MANRNSAAIHIDLRRIPTKLFPNRKRLRREGFEVAGVPDPTRYQGHPQAHA